MAAGERIMLQPLTPLLLLLLLQKQAALQAPQA
jgi:hypothetical protein